MRYLGVLLLSLLLATLTWSEDSQLRARAFELAEHAKDVSAPRGGIVPNDTAVTFSATSADGSVHDGLYTRVFAGPAAIRQEAAFGDFHAIRFSLPGRVALVGPRVLPPEVREMMRLIPIQLWHFDREDVIREIRQTTHRGQPAQCVLFDTIRGTENLANEMCFDLHSGAEIYVRDGNMEIENSEFFSFAGAQLPGHIQQYRNGALMMDVHIARRQIEGPVSPDLFIPPSNANITLGCRSYRRAYGQSMPQPPSNGGAITNVIVHATIGADGRVHDPVIESSDRPDLNDEAIKTALSWTFTPAQCNAKPTPAEANLVIRFQGR